ncbi:MAG: hypothetical protein L0Y72_19410 [Gemmataceae bacterium]|nr:hypothetical protein [Gemmataceae bacterium]
MTITIAQVRAALDPEEPDYEQAAKLGPKALPHLQELVQEADSMLASKAVSLAALIPDERSVQVLKEAARRQDPVVRVAAAAAARHLPGAAASAVLLSLVDDKDSGAQRVALDSVRADATAELRGRIEKLVASRPDPSIYQAAVQALDRIMAGPKDNSGGRRQDGNDMGDGQYGTRRPGVGMGGHPHGSGKEGMGAGGMGGVGMGREDMSRGMGKAGPGIVGGMGAVEEAGMGGVKEQQVMDGGLEERAAAAWERAAAAWERAAAREKSRRG